MNEEIIAIASKELEITKKQINAVLSLLEQGNTVPFIARYRKEMTGSLDEVQIREIEERYNNLENIEKRKQEISLLIHEQRRLSDYLSKKFQQANKGQKL